MIAIILDHGEVNVKVARIPKEYEKDPDGYLFDVLDLDGDNFSWMISEKDNVAIHVITPEGTASPIPYMYI